MDIDIYESSNNGKYIKVFFVIRDGKPMSVKVGNQVVPVEKGIQMYVEKHVGYQIDKCELSMDGLEPKLTVREGEVIEVPGEVEAEKIKNRKEIEGLEKRLKELKNAE